MKRFFTRTLCHVACLLFFLSACQLVSCQSDKPIETLNFGSERYDSTALHIALVPNRDCFPIYVAQRTGIYDSLGLKLQIATYPSQMDCDTTLMGKIADGGWADKERMAFYGSRMKGLEIMWEGTSRWHLFVCGTLRIKNVKSLKERTVAIARSSSENHLLDVALKSVGLTDDAVYRPQINDIKLRADMLNGNQVDAAVLTWPYTSLAYANDHFSIYSQRNADANGCFVMKTRSLKRVDRLAQWKLFEKGRKMALDSIRTKGVGAYSLILQKDYHLPKEVADTLRF